MQHPYVAVGRAGVNLDIEVTNCTHTGACLDHTIDKVHVNALTTWVGAMKAALTKRLPGSQLSFDAPSLGMSREYSCGNQASCGRGRGAWCGSVAVATRHIVAVAVVVACGVVACMVVLAATLSSLWR